MAQERTELTAKEKKAKLAAIKAHKEAVHVKDGWIRDPFIALAPDGYYYLTGTTPPPGDPREYSDPYNTGLGDKSHVSYHLQIWRSKDMVDWEYLGAPYSTKQIKFLQNKPDVNWSKERLWAPELHWDKANGKWLLVHCPSNVSSLAISDGADVKGPWTNMALTEFREKHDPSLFLDDDGTWHILWGSNKFLIRPLKKDFSGFSGPQVAIAPADRKIGHEGATMLKIDKKYVYIGTAWSKDAGRKEGGSYNLYYCTGDSPYGPFTERRFLGRFLGHGTPFKDKKGKWWCTAFYNGNVPPVSDIEIENRDLGEIAQTINQSGTTIVPLDVRMMPDGDVWIRATDPRYENPGPDEVDRVKLMEITDKMKAKLK